MTSPKETLWFRFCRWLAWRLPKTLVYWATIRLVAYATSGKYGNTPVPELTAMDAIDRYGKDNCYG
jgi:hypothetical protein